MFDVKIDYQGISISSVEKNDIKNIKIWCNKQAIFVNGDKDYLGLKEFNQRFIEYYVSECEIFLKMMRGENLIGILKGRIEFKNPNMVWISCFILEHLYFENNEVDIILDRILDYFYSNFGVCKYIMAVSAEDKELIYILENSGFKVERVCSDLFQKKCEKNNSIIYKKEMHF